jgi:16S rRNA C967 or C1407 C5-methylase (RsmB/RsmF family)/NOL1/NOP2/fmu family ribosome biogenesis protein
MTDFSSLKDMTRPPFPEEFLRRTSAQEYLDIEGLLRALREPSPVSIRINRAKWNRQPVDAEPVPWCRNGYYLPSRPSFTLDPLFHSGCYYPQEASGMFLEQVLLQTAGSMKNMRVLDLCGAPGGKSILVSDFIGPDNLLVANEVIRSRAIVLSETITKWGSGNTMVTQNDPAVFGRLPGYFDIILVDAPCSGEGMFRTRTAISEWSTEDTLLCAERQKRILMDIWPCLKENGILIYSTCTFNPAENEDNIRWLTGHNEAECIRLDLKSFEGITEIELKGIFGYGFYPDKVRGEGFFISAVRKKGIQKSRYRPGHPPAELKPLNSDLEIAKDWTEFKGNRLLKWGEEIIGLPCDLGEYTYIYRNLKVVKAGTLISVSKKDKNIPLHELALSTRFKDETFPRQEISLNDAIKFLRRDNLSAGNIPKGWNIMSYKGINLGFIKNIGSRLNNYFPVEWRIRINASPISEANAISWKDNQ